MSTKPPTLPPSLTMADSDIGADELAMVTEVLRSRTLSCGPMIERFEAEWAAQLGVRFAVAVSSGTAGLHLSMIAAGVEDDDLVVTSPYSFVASANAVLYQRAVPVFVDIDPVTLNLDAALAVQALDDLSAGGDRARQWLPRRGHAGPARPAKAVLPVHVFGRPAEMTPIVAAARANDARIIEDACEAIGSEYDGRAAGTFGDAAVFGFFPNKPLAMGEGGVITTDREDWAALFRSLRNQGRGTTGEWLEYTRLGFNYRLDDMSAALGLAQLRRLDELLAKRARVAGAYTAALSIEGVTPLRPTEGMTRMGWFAYVVRFDTGIDRDIVMQRLAARGVPSRPYFPCIHLQPFYRDRFGFREGDFPHAEAASRSTLALPFHANLSQDAIDVVVQALGCAVDEARSPESGRGSIAPRPAMQAIDTPAASAEPEAAPRAAFRTPARQADPSHVERAIDTFLPRRSVVFEKELVRTLITGARVLVTGAGGTIGSELCRHIAACQPSALVMLDRYENGLHAIAGELSAFAWAHPVVGDITDQARLGSIVAEARPDVVIHAAAHKHVRLMERNPCEAVKNNVIGTRFVLDAAIRSGASHFVLISTDKAVRPASVMGATKRVAELIVQRAGADTDAYVGRREPSDPARRSVTRCVSVRFGNVIGSNGSVLHTFLSQVRAGGPLTVTDPEVRRFFMRAGEAAQLVLHAAAAAPAGSIAVLDLGEEIRLVDLARHIVRTFATPAGGDLTIVFTGLHPGEKLSEELVADDEGRQASSLEGLSWVRPTARDWVRFDRDVAALEALAARNDAEATKAALMTLVSRAGQAVV